MKKLNLADLSPFTRVQFNKFSMRMEDGEYIIGNIESGEFVSIPQVGGELLRALVSGLTLQESQDRIKELGYQEVDMESFISDLYELDLIFGINYDITPSSSRTNPIEVPKRNHLSRLFSLPAGFMWLAIVSVGVSTMLYNHSLIPTSSDFFWGSNLAMVVWVNIAFFAAELLSHEAFHVLAAKSYGIKSTIGVSTRFIDFVLETKVHSLWALERKERLKVFMAGLAWDALLFAILLITLEFASPPDLVTRLLKAWALMIFLSMLPQTQLYTRTDLYFFLADFSKCRNLSQDSKKYLRDLIRTLAENLKLKPHREKNHDSPLGSLPSRERKIVKTYSWFSVSLTTLAVAIFLFLGVPILISAITKSGELILQGIHNQALLPILGGVATLLVFLAPNVGFLIVKIYTAKKEHDKLAS